MRKFLMGLLLSISLGALAGGEVALFNGKNFDGWTFFLEEKEYNINGQGKILDFADILPGGIIEINPTLHGALMTEEDYLNYKLHVEWRWVDPKTRNNSGIFLRIRPPFVWDSVHGETSRQYMVQIQPPNTGDLWVLGYSESLLKTDPNRSFKPFGNLQLEGSGRFAASQIRRHLKIKDAEFPLGEWNTLDITLNGKNISVYVNGELVNKGERLVDLPGRIGLESEFGPIQFRNILLTPL